MPTVNPAAMVHRRVEAPSPSHTPTPFWSQTGPYLATPFSKYSDRLKKMCAEGADRRRPEKPDCCRYCGEVMVFLQLTYTVDNAGQWCVICPSCPRRWFPEQEPLLPTQQACIDAIRADDHRKAVERKIALRA